MLEERPQFLEVRFPEVRRLLVRDRELEEPGRPADAEVVAGQVVVAVLAEAQPRRARLSRTWPGRARSRTIVA